MSFVFLAIKIGAALMGKNLSESRSGARQEKTWHVMIEQRCRVAGMNRVGAGRRRGNAVLPNKKIACKILLSALNSPPVLRQTKRDVFKQPRVSEIRATLRSVLFFS